MLLVNYCYRKRISKMEFFARIVNSWKPLSINYCLKGSTLNNLNNFFNVKNFIGIFLIDS